MRTSAGACVDVNEPRSPAMQIGYFLSSEEFDPRELARQARMAEDAGFDEFYIQPIGRDQELFSSTYSNEILPRFNDGGRLPGALASATA
jgi:hypothetical protein